MRANYQSRAVLLLLALCAVFVGNGRAQVVKPATGKALAPLRIKVVAGRQSPPGWKRYQFGEPVLFGAVLPQPPEEKIRNEETPDDGDKSLGIRSYVAVSETANYGLIYMVDDSIRGKSEAEKSGYYNDFASGFANRLLTNGSLDDGAKVEILGERRVKAGGIEGFECELSFSVYRGRLQMFFVGEAALAVLAIWNQENPARERAAFFNSLTMEMAREAAAEAASTPPLANWKRYELGGGSFSIMLPAQPQEEIRSRKFGDTKNVTVTYYKAENDGGFYLLMSVADLPYSAELMPRAYRETFYSGLWQGTIEGLQKWLAGIEGPKVELKSGAARAAIIGGLSGQEREFALGAVQVRGQALIYQKRAVVVMGMWPLETPLAVREAFLRSFKINQPDASVPGR